MNPNTTYSIFAHDNIKENHNIWESKLYSDEATLMKRWLLIGCYTDRPFKCGSKTCSEVNFTLLSLLRILAFSVFSTSLLLVYSC